MDYFGNLTFVLIDYCWSKDKYLNFDMCDSRVCVCDVPGIPVNQSICGQVFLASTHDSNAILYYFKFRTYLDRIIIEKNRSVYNFHLKNH